MKEISIKQHVLLQDQDKPRHRVYVSLVERDGMVCVHLEDGTEVAAIGYHEVDGLWVMTWDPKTGYIDSHTKLGHV